MNKSILFTAIFLIAGTLIVNSATGDDKPGSTLNTGKVSVVVYPNPVMHNVTVSYSEPLKHPIVETFNVNGQKVTPPQGSQGDGSNKTEVDMSNVAPGIYFLKFFNGTELIHVQQLIKQ